MTKIETLKKEIALLEAALDTKRAELHELEIAALPWAVGDIIRITEHGYSVTKGEVLKIVAVYNSELGWPKAVRRRKDGEWSSRQHTIYRGFEVISRHEEK